MRRFFSCAAYVLHHALRTEVLLRTEFRDDLQFFHRMDGNGSRDVRPDDDACNDEVRYRPNAESFE